MQDIYYDSNNKTALTLEQKENIMKVVILAKEFIHGVSVYVFRQKTKFKDYPVNHNAERLFETLKDKFYNDKEKKTLHGNKYILKLDRINKCFLIYRTDNNTVLIKSGLKGHKVQLVDGLTDEDIHQWEQIGNILKFYYRDEIRGTKANSR